MPTIIELAAYRIMINTKDHAPAHVHCVGPGVVVLINIATREVIRNKGVSAKDIRKLQNTVAKYEDILMKEWERIHG